MPIFLYTDIVRSTQLWEHHGQAMQRQLADDLEAVKERLNSADFERLVALGQDLTLIAVHEMLSGAVAE